MDKLERHYRKNQSEKCFRCKASKTGAAWLWIKTSCSIQAFHTSAAIKRPFADFISDILHVTSWHSVSYIRFLFHQYQLFLQVNSLLKKNSFDEVYNFLFEQYNYPVYNEGNHMHDLYFVKRTFQCLHRASRIKSNC